MEFGRPAFPAEGNNVTPLSRRAELTFHASSLLTCGKWKGIGLPKV
jgi:hypothetical protein